MIKNRISIFLATFLIIGLFFLALPEKGYSGTAVLDDCCIDPVDGCKEFPGDVVARCVAGTRISGGICTELGSGGQCVSPASSQAIPTLSEWGLIAMAGALGIVGFMVIRRRKVSA